MDRIVMALFTYMVLAQSAVVSPPVPDPVSLKDCNVIFYRAASSEPKPVAISFENRSAVVADEVHVSVEYGGKYATFVDKGTFSPHVHIYAEFDAFSNQRYEGIVPDSCFIDYVHFADGTVWRPRPAPTTSP